MHKLVAVFVALAIALGAFLVMSQNAAAQVRGGYADSLVWFEQLNTQQAVTDVSAGTNMQLYMFNLRNLADIEAALADPNIRTVITPGSVDDLFVNPAQNHPSVGGFNPFAIRNVREALHWLIDRDFIVEQIFGGHAVPYTSPFHPLQPEYLRDIVFYNQLDSQYGFDPARARTVIFEELGAVPGMAIQPDGRWFYQGSPLTVSFVIRVEDRRFDIGNYVADQLEALGITVDRNYLPAAGAFAIVYFGPADQGAWHLYTEGFGFTALTAWEDAFIAQLGWTASSGDAVWEFYTPSAALVDSAGRLERSQYRDLAERQQLIRIATTEAMKDPVRLMVVAEQAVFINHRSLTGYVYDLSGGPWTLLSSRTARFNNAPGGTLRIGQPVHWNSQWNIYRGFTWLYDATQQRALSDFGMFNHPHLGTRVPIRAAFNVASSGGYDQPPLAVPSDAVWFNATSGAFEQVGTGITAVSKTTFDYTFGKWHDASDMSMDDVWYFLAGLFRRYNSTFWGDLPNPFAAGTIYPIGDLGNSDRRASSATAVTFLSTFKGARQVDADTLEIYLDFWHLDPAEIAFFADILPVNPWHVLAVQDQTVLDGETGYHATTAQTQNRVLLDLIRGASLPLLRDDLATMRAANFIPLGMSGMITAAEATARYTNLATFSTTTSSVAGQTGYSGGHFYVSSGPYWLQTVDVGNRQTVMSRFADYPYDANRWDSDLVPSVPAVTIGTIPQVVPGLSVTIPVTTTLAGAPYDALSLNYLIVNPATGLPIFQGTPTRTATGTWQIALTAVDTSAILPGTYNVRVIGVGSQAAVPVFADKSFVAIPQLAYFEQLLRDTEARLGADIQDAQDSADAAAAAAAQASAQAAAVSQTATIGIAVGAVGIVTGVVGILLGARASRKASQMKPPEQM